MANKEYEEYKSKAKGEPLPSYTYTPRPINIDFNASYSPGRVPMPTYTPRSTPTPTQEEYTVPIPEHLMAPAREVATPSPSPIPTNPPRFRNNQVISPDSNPFAIGNMLWNFMAPMAIGSYALSKPKMPSPLVHTSYPPGSVSPVSYSNPSDFISYPATTPVALPPGTRQPYYNMPGKFNALGEALPKAPTTVSNAIANIQKNQIPPSLMANIRASLQPDITIPPNVMADLKQSIQPESTKPSKSAVVKETKPAKTTTTKTTKPTKTSTPNFTPGLATSSTSELPNVKSPTPVISKASGEGTPAFVSSTSKSNIIPRDATLGVKKATEYPSGNFITNATKAVKGAAKKGAKAVKTAAVEAVTNPVETVKKVAKGAAKKAPKLLMGLVPGVLADMALSGTAEAAMRYGKAVNESKPSESSSYKDFKKKKQADIDKAVGLPSFYSKKK